MVLLSRGTGLVILYSLSIYRYFLAMSFCPGGWFVRLLLIFEDCLLRGRHDLFGIVSLVLESEF